MILIDTSAWIDYLRDVDPAASTVERLIGEEPRDLRICEPVVMELLAGASTPQLPRLERLVNGLDSLPVDPSTDFRAAAVIYRSVRASGHTIRSLNDCLIATIALRHGATLVHGDVDFERIANVTDLATMPLLGNGSAP